MTQIENRNVDLARTLADITKARERFGALVAPLSEADFERARRGGWSVRRIVQHVIESEQAYAKLLAHLRGASARDIVTDAPQDGSTAQQQLAETRENVLAMAEGIDDETLYRLVRIGREEYSALSVLENVAAHDHEHVHQIRDLMRDMARGARVRPDNETAQGRALADVSVRPAVASDAERLNEIYNHYIVKTPTTFDLDPFTLDRRLEWMTHYGATGRHRLLVAEQRTSDGARRVLGYTSTSQFRTKRAYDTTVEMSIICDRDATGLGLGTLLYNSIFDAVRGEDIHSLVAAITLPNDASCRLHERFGFERIAVLPEVGRKFDRYWDVVWYMRTGIP